MRRVIFYVLMSYVFLKIPASSAKKGPGTRIRDDNCIEIYGKICLLLLSARVSAV